jgi:hypothetical protein
VPRRRWDSSRRCTPAGEGNPFFTEQLVAAAQADSVDGALAPPTRLPAGLAELLLARTRRCGEHARAASGALAVAGIPLTEPALTDITGLDPGAIHYRMSRRLRLTRAKAT